ncbi:MAG: S9 family peptidase [Saprospiraceae bacterium]|nr:S9 family peptidase [Saprospiraceae bacterium]
MKPPVAPTHAFAHTYHGRSLSDPYHWLRQRQEQPVIDYLQEENAYTDFVMQPTAALQEQLYQEIRARIKEEDESVPVLDDGYYYYSRTETGQQYKIYCRKKGSLSADEEILLDGNALAADKAYFNIGDMAVSPNNHLLAYSVDDDGSEIYTIFIKDLRTGKLLETTIPNVYYGLVWANDNTNLFYTKMDDTHRPYQLWRHEIGQADDVLVFEEMDETFFLEVEKTKDDAYVFIQLVSKITSEVHFLDAHQPKGEFQVVQPRIRGLEYDVEHYKGQFYIITNADEATNFKLVKTAVSSPSKAHWADVFPYDSQRFLQSFEPFDDFFVIEERVDGLESIRIIEQANGNSHDIKFSEAAYGVGTGENPSLKTTKLRLVYQSLATPKTVLEYDMKTRNFETLKVQEVPGGHDASAYQIERILVAARDGAQVPVSIIYRKDTPINGTAPCYLYGYGSYGVNVDPYFSVARLSLLDRGFVFAIAHIRGSSTKGRTWYEDGKFFNKKNTFTDFVDVAEFLIKNNYSAADQLVANGGSAGGLLMGAVMNLAPHLFNAVVADVPFVDVINTMMDDSIPLTVFEYDEWGNPNQADYFEYMLSYSPYDNLKAMDYPNILVTAGLNDPRVQYWEPAKYVAKLRTLKTGNNHLLLKTNMGAGHGGASGRFDRLKEVALEYAFLLMNLGMER